MGMWTKEEQFIQRRLSRYASLAAPFHLINSLSLFFWFNGMRIWIITKAEALTAKAAISVRVQLSQTTGAKMDARWRLSPPVHS